MFHVSGSVIFLMLRIASNIAMLPGIRRHILRLPALVTVAKDVPRAPPGNYAAPVVAACAVLLLADGCPSQCMPPVMKRPAGAGGAAAQPPAKRPVKALASWAHAEPAPAAKPKAQPKPMQKKQPLPSPPPGAFTASLYTDEIATYNSRDEALATLGSNTRCVGHAARAANKKGPVTFLRCRLFGSSPSCTWLAALHEHPDGSTTLLQHPTCYREHCQGSAKMGSRGVEDLTEIQRLQERFAASSNEAPRTALRTRRLLSSSAESIQLPQVQRIKRFVLKQRFSSSKLGELEQLVSKHRTMPSDEKKGYFCVSFVGKDGVWRLCSIGG